MIPIFQPNTNEEEIDALREVLNSHWLGLGPKTAEFESKFASYIGTNFAVALNSGTSALDLAIRLFDISEGDEVLVPAVTFVSTAHAVVYNRATPVFVDIDKKTLNIDIEDAKNKITARTKAVIPVHYAGRSVDIDSLREILPKNIIIIEDAAHASGSLYKNKKCGSLADIAAFSFHAVKPLAAGEGGAITLNNEDMVSRAKRLRWLGIDKATWERINQSKEYLWDYNVEEIGYKYHMNDLQAALAIVQLKKLDDGIRLRRERANLYSKLLSEISEVECPLCDDEIYKSSWHLYCIKCVRRDDLSAYLKDHEITTGVHYKPIHLHSCYGENKPYLKNAEEAFKKILTLPLFAALTFEEIRYIVDKIKDFYAKNKSQISV